MPDSRTDQLVGVLYVVATPIGNLEDMTYRAVRTLKEVDRIACEDTRVTRRLCTHFDIETPLLRHDEHNTAKVTPKILNILGGGRSVALVTDAGTPAISDPGERLVRAVVLEGFPVVPVPGASAVIAALSAAGLPTKGFKFHGFVPKKTGERRTLWAGLAPGTHALYCPARDLEKIITELERSFPETTLAIGRELTKLHESWYRGTPTQVRQALEEDAHGDRGECVLVLHRIASHGEATDEQILKALRPLLDGGVRTKHAAAEVAQQFGVPQRRVYQLAIRLSDA